MRKIVVWIVVIALILSIVVPSILIFTPQQTPSEPVDLDTLIQQHTVSGSSSSGTSDNILVVSSSGESLTGEINTNP